MKIKIIEDKQLWEEFMQEHKHLHPSFFQSWNWGEFEQSLGKNIFRLGFYRDEELKAVAQTAEVLAKRGDYLHVRNGPVLDWSNVVTNEKVLSGLINFTRQKNRCFLRVSPLIPPTEPKLKLFKDFGFTDSQMHDVDAEITWVLDLDQEEDVILKNMRKNTRYGIRKAEREGVVIETSTDPADLKKFWPIYEDTVKRQQWTAYDYNYIRSQFTIFSSDNQTRLFLAKYKDKYIAGAIFIYYLDEVFYHHSGSLSEFQNIPASYLLQWESIKKAKQMGMKTYNFFGISNNEDKNHPWYGLSFFKKGFGGEKRISIHAKDFPLKPRYWLTHYFEKFERLRKGYS